MLDATRQYRLSVGGADVSILDGAWLIRSGLPFPPMLGEDVLVYEVTAL